jgi:hypothetical protein
MVRRLGASGQLEWSFKLFTKATKICGKAKAAPHKTTLHLPISDSDPGPD